MWSFLRRCSPCRRWGKPFWIEAKNGKAVFAGVTVVTVTLLSLEDALWVSSRAPVRAVYPTS